jgi:error-prone DNA polymerase
MPEAPFPPRLRRPLPSTSTSLVSAPVAYAELHCRSNYSFLEGASHPDELVQQAVHLGHTALAITDVNSLAGVVRAYVAAKAVGLKLLIGSELQLKDRPPLVVWAQNRAGYGRLSRLLTLGRCRTTKGHCVLSAADVAAAADGLLAGVLLNADHETTMATHLSFWREVFPDRCYALAELHHGPDDRLRLQQFQAAAAQCQVPLVAANNVYCHVPERRYLQEVLTAIRLGCTVADLGAARFPNGERTLKSAQQMRRLFDGHPELIERTQEVVERCTFSLAELRYDYPEELCPAAETPLSYLTRLTWAGAHDRYPQGLPDKVRQQIEHELSLIAELHYEAYFLTVWDLVRFARGEGILCQGRGSAANSAVCFCLGVTSVDPDKIDVLFERFISKERDEAPDIDIDFEHERREEVLQYIYQKYGRERAGMTAEVITYRPRSAVRDAGRALGLSLDRIDALAKAVDHIDSGEELAHRCREGGLHPESRLGRQLIHLVQELLGFPRHLSQHVGGMVLTHRPLCELVPIENAAMPGRTVIQWDKDDLDALGILKVDCLALGMLTAIRKGFDLLRQHYHRPYTLATLPAEDPGVYQMIQQADTTGVFQIESRAQMSMLPRLQPKEFYDLVIEVAIVRPGPIQGDMVHPYLRRKKGEEQPDYPKEELKSVLAKTLGVPLFQEQAMKLVVVAAGFTPGEADQLRRAMGAWRKTGVMEQFRQKMLRGMRQNGYTDEFAERLFNQIRGFGEYGFPESHAASFALLVYASAWIKCYYPDVFLTALLNSQPMGFYAPAQLVADARKHGVEVRPVDVNESDWDCTLEPVGPSRSSADVPVNEIADEASSTENMSTDNISTGSLPARSACVGPAAATKMLTAPPPRSFAVRLGWRMLAGLPRAAADTIVRCRQQRRFVSSDEFAMRTGFHTAILSKLAAADAFRSLGSSRRPALWSALGRKESSPLFDGIDQEPQVSLPLLSAAEEVIGDYETAGLSLRNHPLAFLRESLQQRGIVRAAELATLEPERQYRVAGLVLLRQRPSTARGITFVTLEDETGTANLIIHPTTWERFRRAARGAGALMARGILQRQDGVIHLVVDQLKDLSSGIGQLRPASRDFR